MAFFKISRCRFRYSFSFFSRLSSRFNIVNLVPLASSSEPRRRYSTDFLKACIPSSFLSHQFLLVNSGEPQNTFSITRTITRTNGGLIQK